MLTKLLCHNGLRISFQFHCSSLCQDVKGYFVKIGKNGNGKKNQYNQQAVQTDNNDNVIRV